MAKKSSSEAASGPPPLLTSAPPPTPTVATLICIAAISVSLLPAWDEVKEKAILETLGSSPYLDNQALGWLRVACVAICCSAPASWLLYPKEVETNFLPGSKLKDGVVAIAGAGNMIFFTNWAFTLLIFSFVGMAAASFALDYPDYITVSPTMRALTLLRCVRMILWLPFPFAWKLRSGGWAGGRAETGHTC